MWKWENAHQNFKPQILAHLTIIFDILPHVGKNYIRFIGISILHLPGQKMQQNVNHKHSPFMYGNVGTMIQ